MSTNHSQIIVIMVPFLAQGHLNQLLHLSRLISAYNVPVHYVGTTVHNRQARNRIQGCDPKSVSNIYFHEFHPPCFASPPPKPNSPLSHLQPCFDTTKHLRNPFATLLKNFSSVAKRVVVIHDSLMSSVVQDVASVRNAEAYVFHSVSAFTVFLHLWEEMGRPFPINVDMLKDVPSLEGCFTAEFKKFISNEYKCMKFDSGRIYNTCKFIEAPFLDLLARQEISKEMEQWALGPFNPVVLSQTKCHNRPKCLKWLDKQAPNSVIFVSFGTTTSLTEDQIQELAIGLDKSNQKFIWVLRDADKGDIFADDDPMFSKSDMLPKGYEEKIKEKGMIVRDWAPQLEILGHSSTAGFMSHCGWNSIMESITMGVPILAWPMHSDQPRNTVLLTKFLKIGLVVKDWGLRNELVSAETIENAIQKLMNSEEGSEIRERAAKMGDDIRKSVADRGNSCLELDTFVAHISR
ncbi:Glycosyltransferase [Heracleum sosnowskyi]|uniref:Glycosyltransferase n=1 Tax=Heracleum sosnowskyi TaxID=360622 RepID=A0AAD8HDG1_9APIA|nr:Glycosyltransferase [Heracleum sosnowskyi]